MKYEEAFTQAKKNGFFIHQGKADPPSEYWHWCRRNNRAYIRICPGRKYAYVFMDLATTKYDFTLQAMDKVRDLLREYIEQGSYSGVGIDMVTSGKVKLQHVEKLAALLFEISKEPENLALMSERPHNISQIVRRHLLQKLSRCLANTQDVTGGSLRLGETSVPV